MLVVCLVPVRTTLKMIRRGGENKKCFVNVLCACILGRKQLRYKEGFRVLQFTKEMIEEKLIEIYKSINSLEKVHGNNCSPFLKTLDEGISSEMNRKNLQNKLMQIMFLLCLIITWNSAKVKHLNVHQMD